MAPGESTHHLLRDIDRAIIRMRDHIQEAPYTVGTHSILTHLPRGDAWRRGTWFRSEEGPQQYTTFVYHNPMHSDLILQAIRFEDMSRRGSSDGSSKDRPDLPASSAPASARPAKRKIDLKEYTKNKKAAGTLKPHDVDATDSPRATPHTAAGDDAPESRPLNSPSDASLPPSRSAQQHSHVPGRDGRDRRDQQGRPNLKPASDDAPSTKEKPLATAQPNGRRNTDASEKPSSSLPWISQTAEEDLPDSLPPPLSPLRMPTPTLSAPSPDALKRNAMATVLDGRSSIHMRLSMPSDFGTPSSSQKPSDAHPPVPKHGAADTRHSIEAEAPRATYPNTQARRRPSTTSSIVKLKYSHDKEATVQRILGKDGSRAADTGSGTGAKKRKTAESSAANERSGSPKRQRPEAANDSPLRAKNTTHKSRDLADAGRLADAGTRAIGLKTNGADAVPKTADERSKRAASSHSSLVNAGKVLKRSATSKLKSAQSEGKMDKPSAAYKLGILEKVESLACFVRGFSFLSGFKSQRSPTLHRSWETVIPFAVEVSKDCQRADLGPPEAACKLMQAAACKQVLLSYSYPGVEETLEAEAQSKLKETLQDRARMLEATTDAVDALLTREMLERKYPNAYQTMLRMPIANVLQPKAVVDLAITLLKDWAGQEGVKWQPHEELATHL